MLSFLVTILACSAGVGDALLTTSNGCVQQSSAGNELIKTLDYNIYVKNQPFNTVTISKKGMLAFGNQPGAGLLVPSPGMQLPTSSISFPFIAPYWGADFSPNPFFVVVSKCPEANYNTGLINTLAKAQSLPPVSPENILLVHWSLPLADGSQNIIQVSIVTVGQATMVFSRYSTTPNPNLANIVTGYQYDTQGGNYAQFDSSIVSTEGNGDPRHPNIWMYMISTAPCPPIQGVVTTGPPVQCPTILPSDFCVGKSFGPHRWMFAVQNFIEVTCSDEVATCRPFCPAGLVYNYLCDKCVYPYELGCTASLNNRVSCSAADQQSCTNRGCCWDSERTTCFFKTITSVCTVAESDRQVCPGPRYERQDCLDQGCCWDPSKSDASQCYQSQKQLNTTWTTECERVPPPIPELRTCRDVDSSKLNAFCTRHKDDRIYHYPMVLALGEYIQCDDFGRGYCRVCPLGLVFNQEKRICDWPQNIFRI